MSNLTEITQDNYFDKINKHKNVIIDFYSTECPPCEALAPKLDFFAELFKDKIQFFKIYRQGNRELAERLGVKSSPTLLFYKNGEELPCRLNGAIRKNELKNTIIDSFEMNDITYDVTPKKDDYDLAIIGGGPAGLTAALYASRAKINTIVIDKGSPGGFVNITHMVANYPGTGKDVQGFMLGHFMTEQAKNNNAKIIMAADIEHIDLDKKIIHIDDDKIIHAKTIIIATGSVPRKLNIPGENEFIGKGISYCATCDGSFYEGKKVYVIGGGNSAVEEALYLTKFVQEITIIHQFDEFQANKTSADEALNNPKIKVLWHHEPRAFLGDDCFKKLKVEDLKTGQRKILDYADGVFVFIGYSPNTDLFGNTLNKDKWGYLITDENMQTNIEGVYAAGDIRSKKYRQITTAVSDGTIAALEAEKYLNSVKKAEILV